MADGAIGLNGASAASHVAPVAFRLELEPARIRSHRMKESSALETIHRPRNALICRTVRKVNPSVLSPNQDEF